jgi:hypothetical protein
MEKIPMETQTLYAELLEQLTALEAQRSIGSLPGGFTTKEIKGETYYYFQYSEPGGGRKQVYVGKASPPLDRLVERWKAKRPEIQADMKSIQRLCAQLRVGGAVVSAHAQARVLQSLADAGVFRMGGVLVGTHAFAAMGNVLGRRWERGGMETQDVDIAWERDLDLAVPDLQNVDVPNALERLQMGFFPVPALDPASPSTSFKVRRSPLRVDVLTPARSPKEEYKAIKVPRFKTAAQALKYLDYLIEAPRPAAIIGAGGILVQVPDPAKFAFHKLIVAQERPVSEHAKKAKDLRQAALLCTVLADERPGDLQLAWEALVSRGKPWEKRAVKGMETLRKLHPETPVLTDLVRSSC